MKKHKDEARKEDGEVIAPELPPKLRASFRFVGMER
jgi:hypothetical protein